MASASKCGIARERILGVLATKGAGQVPTTAGFRPLRFPPYYLHIISFIIINKEAFNTAIIDLKNQKTFNYNIMIKKHNINNIILCWQFKNE